MIPMKVGIFQCKYRMYVTELSKGIELVHLSGCRWYNLFGGCY